MLISCCCLCILDDLRFFLYLDVDIVDGLRH